MGKETKFTVFCKDWLEELEEVTFICLEPGFLKFLAEAESAASTAGGVLEKEKSSIIHGIFPTILDDSSIINLCRAFQTVPWRMVRVYFFSVHLWN